MKNTTFITILLVYFLVGILCIFIFSNPCSAGETTAVPLTKQEVLTILGDAVAETGDNCSCS